MKLRKLKRVKAKRQKGGQVKGHPDITSNPLSATALPREKYGKPSGMEFKGKKLLQVSANNIKGNIEQGNILRDQGRFTEAIACYQLVLNVLPDDAETHYNLGITFKLQGNLNKAIISYQRAIATNPDFPQAYCSLGNVFSELGELDKAVTLYRQSITLNPDDAEAHYNLGVVFTDIGKLDDAVVCYQQAIAINPNSMDSHYNLGVIFSKQGKPEKAISCYRQALAIAPNDPATHFNLGIIFKEQGELEKAISSLQHAISVKPDFAEAFFNLGVLFSEQEKTIEAKANYQRVIELDPDNCSANHMLAAVCGKTTETAPQEHIKKLFGHYSAGFDHHLVRQLAYQVPEDLYICLQSIIDNKTRFSNVIDLGCGTGLSGRPFRNISDRLTGIDLSLEMIRIAKGKKIYDSMQIGGVVEYLEATEEKFDLFIATDVFVYIGSLEAIFKAVEECSLPQAYFIFSTESTENDDFVLLKSGRYGHSRTYIQALAQKHGFKIELCQATTIRKAKEQLIAGDLFILRDEKN